MIDTIKKIVSEHTRIPVGQLQSETLIGRSAIGNSIVLHHMYAAIAKEGTNVPGYQEIQTFGELMNKISGGASAAIPATMNRQLQQVPLNGTGAQATSSIGIDIEEIANMPVVADCREDGFYKMNFTPAEMAYCLVQPEPYASFAGLFAAKEAIVKADNTFKTVPFNEIFIDHLPGGQPVFNGFSMSISHVKQLSVAIAVKNAVQNNPAANLQPLVGRRSPLPAFLSIVAMILSLIAIFLMLRK